MKNLIIAIVIVLGIGYYLYSKNSTSEITFTMDDKNLQLSSDSFKYVFERLDPFEIEGYVSQVGHENNGPFSVFNSTSGIVWGDAAIELASASEEKMKDRSSFSTEAQEVFRTQGCPAKYLNQHLETIATTAENAIMDKALRALKNEDMVRLSGYKVRIISADFEGIPTQFDKMNVVCVTEATINGENVGILK